MEKFRSVKLRWLHGHLSEITYGHSQVHFAHYPSALWRPAINAFRCDRCIRICVDLAGVEKDAIEVVVEPGLLLIRGTRTAPEPTVSEGKTVRVLALEIDSGSFEREMRLPADVDVEKVTAEQKNGLLWIQLPVQ